ncbi:MAG: aspartate aminotransferase [Chloroflexi bacterium RBG_16_60_22]|nr:MAG: aspartate aminotransferase [Chloroflexi bacterium RBG_16_60_22]
MSVSARVKKGMEVGSWIRRMFEEGIAMKKQFGAENVIDLSLGNPVMEPPPEFKRELKRLVENPFPGMHGYMENAGYPETRAAVAAQLTRETGIRLTQKDVIMACGAAGAINVALKTILDPGDEVILFLPWFVDYFNYVENHDGVVKLVPTDDGFIPRLDLLEAAIGPRTRAVLIDSPNNPTGVVYSADLMRRMGEILRKKEAEYGTEIFIVSDEPYKRIIYDGIKYPSPLNVHRHSIIATSHSKDLSIAGERIGYIALHPESSHHDEMMTGFVFCTRTLGFINAPALMQNVVRRLQDVTIRVAEYQHLRDFIYGNLVRMGYEVVKPQGAFYIFPRCPIKDDVAFVHELQREHHVLTVPGVAFGTPGYFRLVYCVREETLARAMPGLEAMAKKYKLAAPG